MHRNLKKVVKIFVVVFLCSEMQFNFQQQQSSSLHSSTTTAGHLLNSSATALLEESKHQASIRLKKLDQVFGEGHICSGALIAPSVVLTAARCIYNFQLKTRRHASEFRVVLGSLTRYSRTEHTLAYGVTHAFYPASFEPKTLKDDIALLMLERDVPAQHATVQPISLLPLEHMETQKQFQEEPATQTGWGNMEMGLPVPQLLVTNMTRLPAAHCANEFSLILLPGMACAGLSSNSAHGCLNGEAGAPLKIHNKLLGISSGFDGCALNGYPAIYTDVRFHQKWIYAHMGTGCNQNGSFWGTLGFLLFTVLTLRTVTLDKY